MSTGSAGVTRSTSLTRRATATRSSPAGTKTYPDFPTITWTADKINPAVSYIGREIKENHFTVDT